MTRKPIRIPRRDGLVGEWKLDGNALDTAGTNNGTATNVTYTNTDRGYQKQAGVFNGTSTYITAAHGFGTGNINFDYNVLFYVTATQARGEILVLGNQNVTNQACLISVRTQAGGNDCIACDYPNVGGWKTTNRVIYNEWNRLHISKTGNTYTVTLNGNVETFTFSGLNVSSNQVIIGQSGYSAQYFNGRMQSVRLFNRVLSTDEINDWYLEGIRKLGKGSYAGLTDGMVAYYDMRGDANDIVGGNNGTVTGATLTTNRFSNSNSAYSFDGNDYIDISSYLLPSNNSSFSILITAKSSSTTVQEYVSDRYGASYYYKYRVILQSNGRIQFYMYNSAGFQLLESTNTGWNDGTYHHIMVVYSLTNMYLYIDGALNNSASTPGYYPNNTNATRVGMCTGPSNENYFVGTIDSVLFFNTTKSAAEVKALYDLSKLDYILPIDLSKRIGMPENLKANCVLDFAGDTSGTTEFNVMGGNNATLVGTPGTQRNHGYKGLTFNGSSQGGSAACTSINDNYSAFFIMKPASASAASPGRYPFLLTGPSGASTYMAWSEATQRVFYLVNTSGTFFPTATLTVSLTRSTSFGITVSGGSMKIYQDGTLVSTVAYTGTARSITAMEFGKFSTNFWDGTLYRRCLFNSALGANEHMQLHYSFFIP